MTFKSINPYTGEELATYTALNESQIQQKLALASDAFVAWRKTSIKERSVFINKVAELLRRSTAQYAEMMSIEMGKPITESLAEVEKCAWVCDYYAEHAAAFLANETIVTDAQESFVRHEPLGAILGVMPWNFPFWQVFRFAVPTLLAGNTVLLKHASNVLGCANLIEEAFEKAGFPKGVFQNLIVHHDQIEYIIAQDTIKAISLTGSESAGASVAALAGRHIKKSVLELGGNNAFIVCEDADIDQAVDNAIIARMRNAGQSCIAAKRFIVVQSVYDEFLDKFKKALGKLKVGDPMHAETQLGTLAREDLAEKLEKQIDASVAMGATLIVGGNRKACFFEPTIVSDVVPGMPVFDEETFGPLAAFIRAKDTNHAFELAAQTRYGLGLAVFTRDIAKAKEMIPEIGDGAFFVNQSVRSDPRLPFGGTKVSGFGRELGKDGIMEFVNRKTVYIA